MIWISNYGDNRAFSQSGSRAELIRLLSLVDVLEPLSAEERDWLAQRTTERRFQGGDTVYVSGDASEAVYLLLAGRIRLHGMAGGQELTFDVLQTGALFGLASLMEQNPEVNARLVKLLGDRLRLSRSRMMDIALKEVPARLASLILDLVQSEGVVTREGHYKIVTHYTHEQLATMIGAKRVAVTKAFGKLQDAECVRLWRRQIYVIDLATLRRWSKAR